MPEAIDAIFFYNLRVSGGFCPFGHDNNFVPGSFFPSLHDQLTDLLHLKMVLWNQNDIGPARLPSFQGQPTRMSSHRLHDKDPSVRTCSRPETIYFFRDHIHSGLKSQGVIRPGKVFVDGLRNAHRFYAFQIKLVNHPKGILASDRH